MCRNIVTLFPLWAFVLAVSAYRHPDYFAGGKTLILPLLAAVMLTMGMTLTWRHFKAALKRPGVIVQQFSLWSL